MDELDRAIVGLLSGDARISLATMARKLKVARSTVQARLERLETTGVIAGYTVKLGEAARGSADEGCTLVQVLVAQVELAVAHDRMGPNLALGVALFYLLLSGSNVATERAFLMVSVMLGAVLFDRRALSMRSVALAGIVLVLWQPESLTEPGFQLSFAATVALIAAFDALDGRVMRERLPRWVMPLFTPSITTSSLAASCVTSSAVRALVGLTRKS